MKKLSYFLGLIFITTALMACEKDNSSSNSDDNNNSNNQNNSSQSAQDHLINNQWKITYFYDDKDETHHFQGYVFDFSDDGSVKATKNGNMKNGSWSTGSDDSKSKLILNFGNEDPFEELNEDWHILESSSEKIKLEHVSGGDGSTDHLTFEKN